MSEEWSIFGITKSTKLDSTKYINIWKIIIIFYHELYFQSIIDRDNSYRSLKYKNAK